MSDRVEEIRARLKAATPGPWGVTSFESEHVQTMLNAGQGECWAVWADVDGHCLAPATTGNGPTSEANAEFIAHAPGDLAFLLSLLEQVPPPPATPQEPSDRAITAAHEAANAVREHYYLFRDRVEFMLKAAYAVDFPGSGPSPAAPKREV